MTISAKILTDSLSPEGKRLTTMELRYPRFFHAEFMTHRVFSRNASSSRAIPVERLILDCLEDTAIPSHWGKNEPGMQAREEHDAPVWIDNGSGSCSEGTPQEAWNAARDAAVAHARAFAAAGYHKQIVNRIIEPYVHINVVVSATEWDNYFKLRMHPDAEPHIHLLATAMYEAKGNSIPNQIPHNGWHLPYVTQEDLDAVSGDVMALAMISAARCARVSYKTHDGAKPDVTKDFALAQRLATSGHWSPFEHQAMPSITNFGNFRGWRSLRTMLE
jgi:hypothetical protein